MSVAILDKSEAWPTADVVADDRHGRPVLLVETRHREADAHDIRQLAAYLEAAAVIPYAMLVTPTEIAIFRWDGRRLSDPVCRLATEPILSHYDAGFGTKRVSGHYLVALVEAWLRDIAYGWKSTSPPGLEALGQVGLLDDLSGGTTRVEVPLRGRALSRD